MAVLLHCPISETQLCQANGSQFLEDYSVGVPLWDCYKGYYVTIAVFRVLGFRALGLGFRV